MLLTFPGRVKKLMGQVGNRRLIENEGDLGEDKKCSIKLGVGFECF